MGHPHLRFHMGVDLVNGNFRLGGLESQVMAKKRVEITPWLVLSALTVVAMLRG